MSSRTNGDDDPLVAALPPAMDYMTYLTLLEYQLSSTNLSTLTRLLSEDDGTLAQEIGWDLLKLCLPLLDEAPGEVAKCLEVVARRGNPREVVIRVAEELERLAQDQPHDDYDEDQAFSEEDNEETLPTFAGEAQRIHLGTMSLEGMPAPSDQNQQEIKVADNGHDSSTKKGIDSASEKFRILLSMLSLLHPRIQTKYPSRFLATSLPAALGAYRELPITCSTTSEFLKFLQKMSGKQRPALPPRVSSVSLDQDLPVTPSTSATSAVPLPDPEAGDDTSALNPNLPNEKDIILRLLQAVTLEVLDEFIRSLGKTDPRSLSWTKRMREKREPNRILPSRQTETELWQEKEELRDRDAVIRKVLQLSTDLSIDIPGNYETLFGGKPDKLQTSAEADSTTEKESPSEYPRSPSEIPLSKSGTFLLFVANLVVPELSVNVSQEQKAIKSNTPSVTNVELTSILRLLDDKSMGIEDCIPLIDATLSLVILSGHDFKSHRPSIAVLQQFLLRMSYIWSICPDTQMRDSAHAIATTAFHQFSDPNGKIEIITHLLTHSEIPSIPVVVIGWLKDELVAFAASHGNLLSSSRPKADSPPVVSDHEGSSIANNKWITPSIFTDTTLKSALFEVPDPKESADSAEFLQNLPRYIASLNLLDVLLRNEVLRKMLAPSEQPTEFDLWRTANNMLECLQRCQLQLDAEDHKIALQATGLEMIDIWSFEDAMKRVSEAIGKDSKASSS